MFKDGKEFKAHRRVLSEGSLLFKKVLNSETKESTEEIFRLEMICESVTEKVLEYVCPRYTTQTSEPSRRLIRADKIVLSCSLGITR